MNPGPVYVYPRNYTSVSPGAPLFTWTPTPPPATEGWTIYDVLGRCVESARWGTEAEKQAAVAIVERLRAANALGTVASQVHLSTEGEA